MILILAEAGVDYRSIPIDDALMMVELISTRQLRQNLMEQLGYIDKTKFNQMKGGDAYSSVESLIKTLTFSRHLSALYESLRTDYEVMSRSK